MTGLRPPSAHRRSLARRLTAATLGLAGAGVVTTGVLVVSEGAGAAASTGSNTVTADPSNTKTGIDSSNGLSPEPIAPSTGAPAATSGGS